MDNVFSEILEQKPGKEKIIKKKELYVPENIEFSYSLARIPIDVDYNITLKAKISNQIPIGSVILVKSDNDNINILENQLTIKRENIKMANTGEEVAVINFKVNGKKINEKGAIRARAGKYSADIDIIVIESVKEEKQKKFPKVLLSNTDDDPSGIAPGGKVILDPRQPLVYQRPQDIKERIYWINTSSPLAKAILGLGENSIRWRDYLLQRYIDIFVKEAIFRLQQKEPDSFTAERIDSDILDALINKIHYSAFDDLNDFLFNENYDLYKEN